MDIDKKFIHFCFFLAQKANGKTFPNPKVGAVVVKNNKIAGSGFHEFFGGKHAEAVALEDAGKKAIGAVLYSSLEPCSHFGKQPPCSQQIVRCGIKKVVIGAMDPTQKKKGIVFLKKNGVKVVSRVLEKQAVELNKEFFKLVKTKKPFVTVKIGMSLDAKISFGNGKRKQISGHESKKKLRELRKQFQAILVGKNTVLKDNPRLLSNDKQNTPIRIVLSSNAKLPQNLNIFSSKAKTLVVCTKKAREKDIFELTEKGIGLLVCREKNSKVDLNHLMQEFGKAKIASVLVEAGPKTMTSFLKENLVDELIVCISPKIFGVGTSFVLSEKIFKEFKIKNTEQVGNDLWVWLEKRNK